MIREQTYTWLDDIAHLMSDIPADSIVSRTIHKESGLKGVLFGFDAGQSLSEHSAGQTAIVHILSGEATITIGDDVKAAGAGAYLVMPPRMKHSIVARTPLVMLLLLIAQGE
jgi:quercetin dioxygenase-like cupin family protein